LKPIGSISVALAGMVVFATYSLPASASKVESARAAQVRAATTSFKAQGYHDPL
jgi:hypothetical protein